MVNWLRSFREELAVRRGDGRQTYCQRCRKDSDWKDDLTFSKSQTTREDALGAVDLPRILTEAPFPVYGLKGNPMGLRLTDLDLDSRSHDSYILRYVAGEPSNPMLALDLTQGADLSQGPEEELRAVIGLVLGCAPEEQRALYLDRRNVHRDWNLDRLSRAPRRSVTIRIDGLPAPVEYSHWDEPQQITLARMAPGGRPSLAVSMGLPHVQLLRLLKGLVSLNEDADALAEH